MKYLGSKSKLAKHLVPIINSYADNCPVYVEPFCGSLAIISQVQGFRHRIANDINPYLIALWRALQEGHTFPTDIPRDYYNYCRNEFNADFNNPDPFHQQHLQNIADHYEPDPSETSPFRRLAAIGWVGFMASFNGRFFDGGYSGTSGKRDYIREQINNTLAQLPDLLREPRIRFRCATFDLIDTIVYHSDFNNHREQPLPALYYCDPPYLDTKQYVYSRNFNYPLFYHWCKDLYDKGNEVLISEYAMPVNGFTTVWQHQHTNSMATRNTHHPVECLFVPRYNNSTPPHNYRQPSIVADNRRQLSLNFELK
jgi:DNA adenine methylase